MKHLHVIVPLSLTLSALLQGGLSAAEDSPDAAAVVPAVIPVAVETSPWSHHLKLGLFLNSVSSSNASASNDPSISGTSDSATYSMSIDGRLKWQQGLNSVQNDLKLKFGRKYDEVTKWQESTDEIDYDGNYSRKIKEVHHYYVNIGLDSVFTGPAPEEDPLDPATGKASTGYAFKRTNILPEKDSFETRVGVRVQRTWGKSASAEQKDTQTGIEWVTRYERKQNKQTDYFAQYDFFSEFADVAHTTHLLTAGINYKITPVFTLKFDIRAYYETEPEDLTTVVDEDTYDTFAMRQETNIGITYEF